MFPLGVHVVSVIPGFIKTKMLQGLKTPAPLTASPNQVATSIIKAVEKKKDVVYVLWFWKWIMLIIKMIPEGIFKKLKL
jgi:short-subunit dehydrogenase